MATASANGMNSIPISQPSLIENKAVIKGNETNNNTIPTAVAEPLQRPNVIPTNNTTYQAEPESNIPMAEHVPAFLVPTSAVYYKSGTSDKLEKAKKSNQNGGGVGVLFINVGQLKFEGRFIVPKKLNFVCVLHGASVDLTDAQFIHPETVIDVVAVLGGCKIIIPPGVRVKSSGVAIMGGIKAKTDRSLLSDEDMPLIHVRGVSILGGVKVFTDPMKPQITIGHLG